MPKRSQPRRNRKVYERSTTPHGARRPPAPDASAAEVWERVGGLLVDEIDAGSASAPKPTNRTRGAARKARRRRRRVHVLDMVALLIWGTVLVKLCVADLDRVLVNSFWPQAVWIVDLRWAVALVLVAVTLWMFRLRTIALAAAYVATYPLVLLFWKLPKALLKRRSRALTFAIANFMVGAFVHARGLLSTLAVTTTAVLIIVLSQTTWLIAMGAVALSVTLIWTIVSGTRDLMRSSGFLVAQQKAIEWIIGTGTFEQLLTPKHPDKLSIKDWTVDDAKAYRDAAGSTVLVRRGLRFWAYAIDEYRRGPVIALAGVGLVVWMLVQVAVAFSFISYAIYQIDPLQFSFQSDPQWWTFLHYAVTSMYFGEIGALQAVGLGAVLAKLANGVLGVIVIGLVIAGVLLTYRAGRREAEAAGAVRLLEREREHIDRLAVEDYKLGIDQLEERLASVAWGLKLFARWLHSQVPSSWHSDSDAR
jgi:hypothetical protein